MADPGRQVIAVARGQRAVRGVVTTVVVFLLGLAAGGGRLRAQAMPEAPAAPARAPEAPGSPQQRASEQGSLAGFGTAPTPLPVPAGLPVYQIQAGLDPAKRRVLARQTVTFTNRTRGEVTELVFHVYPRYKVPDDDRLLLAKTLEVFRLSPEEAMDLEGRRLEVSAIQVDGQAAAFHYDPTLDTILVVPLARVLPSGGTTTAVLDFTLELPEKWGRWGHYEGVTYLVNWYPTLAYHDEGGWDRTPFVPWHQPWHQEAGHYRVVLELPEDEVVASTGRIVSTAATRPGWKRLEIVAPPSRDFALVCSNRFETLEQQVGRVRLRVHTLPEDRVNAEALLGYASEAVAQYEGWFGPYYDTEFEVAPSYFGWNGNECSGLVLLDRRIFKLPSVGTRYLDHLVSHETCHQWWWNAVGTDGYAETFMDEGLVNAFTAIRLDAKYGRNAPLIVWPRGLTWLPTIGREDLRLASYHGWRKRGGGGAVIQDLDSIGNLESLFSLAYDRGGKVVQMIHSQMGEERFFAFFQRVYTTYAFRTLSYERWKAEMAAFDPGGGWPERLDSWLLVHNDCDWAVADVGVRPVPGDPSLQRVTVHLEQRGQLEEPTVLLCQDGDREIRVPIWPDRGSYDVPGGVRVERLTPPGPGDTGAAARYVITLDARGRPSQVEVDPDHALLDAVPDNNRWRSTPAVRLTPVVTPMDHSSWFQPHDRVGLVAGPFVDQYARAGLQVAAQRADHWQLSGWMGVEPSLSEAIFGGQAILLNRPAPMWNAGVFFEEGLYNFHNDQRHSGGRAFLRKRLATSSSFIVDDPAFFEVYYGFGNEFWPGDDGRPTRDWLTAFGARFFRNTQFPYWDPVQGEIFELAAERGEPAYGSPFEYTRIVGQYGLVRTLPESYGRLSRLRFALRAYGGFGWGDEHFLFRLGGGRRLRALNLQQEWGSSVWLVTSELRFPIWTRMQTDLLDNTVQMKNLYGVAFVDVGQSYFNGEWNPLVFGPGLGLRLDVALFSFLERATLRLDIAQPIYGPGGRTPYRPGDNGPVVWVGLNQAF